MLDIIGLTFTVTAVSLPLSGLWAATALEPIGNGGGQAHHQQQHQYRAQVFEAQGKALDSNDNSFAGTTRTANSETDSWI